MLLYGGYTTTHSAQGGRDALLPGCWASGRTEMDILNLFLYLLAKKQEAKILIMVIIYFIVIICGASGGWWWCGPPLLSNQKEQYAVSTRTTGERSTLVSPPVRRGRAGGRPRPAAAHYPYTSC